MSAATLKRELATSARLRRARIPRSHERGHIEAEMRVVRQSRDALLIPRSHERGHIEAGRHMMPFPCNRPIPRSHERGHIEAVTLAWLEPAPVAGFRAHMSAATLKQ